MIDLNKKINEYKEKRKVFFNEQNFYVNASEERYNGYLSETVLKYVHDKEFIKKYVEEKDLGHDSTFYGIFDNDKCIVPKRKKLIDEMISIHEITHFISHLANKENDECLSKEVIPCFNEYDYLKRINKFYSECYLKYLLNKLITSSQTLQGDDIERIKPYLYAYEVLCNNKEDYNIHKLNKVNTKSKTLQLDLEKKGYTI